MNKSYKKEQKKMITSGVKVHHGLPCNKSTVRGQLSVSIATIEIFFGCKNVIAAS